MKLHIREKIPASNENYNLVNFLEDFPKWQEKHPSKSDLEIEDQFSIYFQHYAVERSTYELQCDLSYQIYQLQQCVEGLIEDMEAG